MKVTRFFLFVWFCAAMSGYGWEQKVVVEGFLRRAERIRITKAPDGKGETKVEKSIVLVTDKPLVLSRSVTIGNQQVAATATSYSHLQVYLAEEFVSLIGKRVQCSGYFTRSSDLFLDEIVLDVDTVLDCDLSAHQLKTVFYEPEEVEFVGRLHKTVYPGPPEYTSVEMGDCPEEVIILHLEKPIDVDVVKGDDFNEPEKAVYELQVVFENAEPTTEQMKGEISLKGTLYHAHTAHHRRRVLMTVKDWRDFPHPLLSSERSAPQS